MGIGDTKLIHQLRSILEQDFHAPTEGKLIRVAGMVFAGPFRIFPRFDLVPKPDGISPARPLRRIAIHMVPTAIL